MIDLYTWGTPNGRKVSVMLEEAALPYQVHPIDIGTGAQFEPAFVAISPNGKIPAIVDPYGPDGEPIALAESGAILIYLASKTNMLLPATARGRFTALQWLMFQMGHIGPMFGQAHHFMRYAPEQVPYAIARYGKEVERLYGVLERRLNETAYLAGDEYSIADIATYPWVAQHDWHGIDLDAYAGVRRWVATVGERPAVQRGMRVPQ